MSQIKEAVDYIKRGFQLLNKTYLIFLIASALQIISNLLSFQKGVLGEFTVLPLQLIVAIIDLVFMFLTPLFLLNYLDNKTLSFTQMFETFQSRFKEVFFPVISIMVFTIIISTLVVIPFTITLNTLLKDQQNTPIYGLLTYLNPSILLSMIAYYFFLFTPMYFLFLHYGIFESLKQSVIFSFKNIPFMSTILILTFVIHSLLMRLPLNLLPGQLVYSLIYLYLTMGVSFSAFLYFRSKEKIK